MILRVLFALAVFATGVVIAAEPEACFVWTVGGFTSSSPNGAASQYLDSTGQSNPSACGPSDYFCYSGFQVDSCSPSGAPTAAGQSFTCQMSQERTPGPNCTESGATCMTPATVESEVGGTSTSGDCPPDDTCESMAGMSAYGGVAGSPTGDFCRADDGSGGPGGDCKVKKSGAGMSTGSGWFGQVEFTGDSCSGEDEDLDEGAANCITSPGGRVCLSKQDKNCGSVNGERVCLDSVPPGSCTLLSGGGAVCDGSPGSTAGPVDSEGDPIAPDAVIEQHDGEGGSTSANYFSQTTINNSAGGVTGSDNDGSGGDGDGDGDGGGPEECTSDEDCFGEVADTECSEDLAACFATTVDGWYGTFGATSLLATSAALYTSIPTGGTCPTATVEILGETHDAMASFCSLMVDNGAVLQLFFQIAWSFGGLLIMLGARSS